MTTLHVVVNRSAAAGKAGPLADRVTARLRRAGAEVHEVPAATAAAARAAIAEAANDESGRVVIVGGDGAVHQAIQVLAGTDTPLAVVPVGTGNDFARAVGLDRDDLDATCRAVLADPVALDAVRTSRGWYATIGTAGFPAVVNDRANRLRFPKGERRYALATLLELPGLRPLPLRLRLDDTEPVDVEVTILAVANTAYFGGGMAVCPAARPDDGVLDLTIVGPVGRIELLRVFPRVFEGRHLDHPAVRTQRARTVRIEPLDGREAVLWADGEPLGALPVEMDVVPGALHVAGAAPAPT